MSRIFGESWQCQLNCVYSRRNSFSPRFLLPLPLTGQNGKEKSTKKKIYVPKPYDTPKKLGVKWQLDVKYVPKACYVGRMPDKFYQYTVIDEASRERFIYAFREQSSYSSVEFIKMAIKHFGYQPKIIQTDNGFEFTHFRETQRTHPFIFIARNRALSTSLYAQERRDTMVK